MDSYLEFFESIGLFSIPLNEPVLVVQNEDIAFVEWIPLAVDFDKSRATFSLDLEQTSIVKLIRFYTSEAGGYATLMKDFKLLLVTVNCRIWNLAFLYVIPLAK